MDGQQFDQLSRLAVVSRRSVVVGLVAALATDVSRRLGFGHVALAACRDRNGRKCDGCCRGGSCQSGVTFDECGHDGESCRSCRDVFKECDRLGSGGGKCICSKRSCGRKGERGGCCTALGKAKGTCKSGTADDACGDGGRQCADCAKLGQTCDPETRKCTGGGACRHAGETCSAMQKCCESSEVLECRSGTCCALAFGVCQIPADCCDPTHTCFSHTCQ
jgi:hypothetical protein